MAFSFSGRAAQGAHDNLQELLAAQLAEEMARADQAQRDRQIGQTDRRLGLDEQQHALDVRGQDFVEKERGADIEQESMDKMRGHQAETQKRLDLIQQQQDQDEYIAQQPANVQRILGGLSKFGVKPTAESLKDPEAERAAGIEDYRTKKQIDLETRPPSDRAPDRQWLMRDGQEVYDVYRPGDTRAGTAGGGGAGGRLTDAEYQRKTRMDSARSSIDILKGMSAGIHKAQGMEQFVDGAVRSFKAKYGYDPPANFYNTIKDSAGATLAVAVMGAQNLSDRDRAIWDQLVPPATMDKATANAVWAYLTDYLREKGTPERDHPANTPAIPPPDLVMGIQDILMGKAPKGDGGGGGTAAGAPAGASKYSNVTVK